MTRKHFQSLADALAKVRPNPPLNNRRSDLNRWAIEYALWNKTRRKIAEACAEHNEDFSVTLFLKATEV